MNKKPDLFISPIGFIRFALYRISVIQWAVGVGALIAVLAITSKWGLPPVAIVLGTIALLLFMVALFVVKQLIEPPPKTQRKVPLTSLIILWTVVILFVVGSGLTTTSFFFQWPLQIIQISANHDSVFPVTKKDKQLTDRLLNSVGSALSSLDRQFELFDNFCDETESYLKKSERNRIDYKNLKEFGIHVKEGINKSKEMFLPIKPDVLKWLSNTPIRSVDAEGVSVTVTKNSEDLSSTIDSILNIVKTGYPMDTKTQLNVVSISRKLAYQYAIVLWYNYNELLLPVSQQSQVFKEILEPFLVRLNYFSKPEMRWTNSLEECQLEERQAQERLNGLLLEYAANVGNMRSNLFNLKSSSAKIVSSLLVFLKRLDEAGQVIALVQKTQLPLLESVWQGNNEGYRATITSRSKNTKIIVDDIEKNLELSVRKFITNDEMMNVVQTYAKLSTKIDAEFTMLQGYFDELNQTRNELQKELEDIKVAGSVEEGQLTFREISTDFDSMLLLLQYCSAQIQFMVDTMPNSKVALDFTRSSFVYLHAVDNIGEIKKLTERRATLLEQESLEVKAKENYISSIEKKTKQIFARIKDKFLVKPNDDAGIVWGKMVRMLSAGFKEEALKDLNIFIGRTDDPNASIYAERAKLFIQEYYPNKYNGGVIVLDIKNPLSSLRIGDIVSGIDGNAVYGVDDFVRLKKARNKIGMTMTVWRLENTKTFKSIKISIKPSNPPVKVAGLGETLE